jgi:hypothetical protein
MFGSYISGKMLLEGLQVSPEDEITARHDLFKDAIDLFLELLVLPRKVHETDLDHFLFPFI